MLRNILTSVAASLITAVVFWAIAKLEAVSLIVEIPSGMVVAFDSETCPSGEWEEYKLAYGRFVRGIDKSGTNIDPDGKREPGGQQDDSFERHDHIEHPSKGNLWLARYKPGDGKGTWPGEKMGNILGHKTEKTGDAETRPKNVALLYCKKG